MTNVVSTTCACILPIKLSISSKIVEIIVNLERNFLHLRHQIKLLMKYCYAFFLAFVLPLCAFAQVGINTTTPHPSSILDIAAENRGVLFPRIALTGSDDTTTVENPAEGLMIYNTTNANGITPGFYFWSGSDWSQVEVANGSSGPGGGSGSWSVSGNTASATDFLGTTNWNALKLKVNDQQMGQFHPNGGITLGLNAQANNNNAIAIGTGAKASNSNEATAVGPSSEASGYQSAAFGYNARALNGNSSLALGKNAEASSYQATAIGVNAKARSNNNAMAIGTNSEATGQNSSALGMNANATAQNATAIGYGATANQANTLILGNTLPASSWEATKIGIGVSNPSEKVEVKGTVKISDGDLLLQNGSLKIVDGTQGNGKVLTSDANGNASWQEVSQQTAFADMSASSSQLLNSSNAVRFANTTLSENINTNNTAAQVTISGIYRVTYSVSVTSDKGGNKEAEFFLAKNNSSSNIVTGSSSFVKFKKGDAVTATVSKILQLNAWQQIGVFTNADQDEEIETIEDGTFLTIELLKAN